MLNLFKNKKEQLPVGIGTENLVYKPFEPSPDELRETEKAFARLFLTDDGQRVLSHLQRITFSRVLGQEATQEQLRYLEGQRSLVATILRLVDRGRRSKI